jgi:hypothetical protein
VETKPREQSVPESVMQGPIGGLHGSIRPDHSADREMDCASITQSEWEDLLASAVLHLVGAYRAMETLSGSAFPAGAPGSFEIACHCLCTALVTLDACLQDARIDPQPPDMVPVSSEQSAVNTGGG